MQAVPVGNVRPMCCHEVEGMFFIPDGRCTNRCSRRGEMTELALGRRDFLKPPVGLRREPRDTGGVDCQARTLLSPLPPPLPRCHGPRPLAPRAAVSRPVTI
jgi:hypothetical protein